VLPSVIFAILEAVPLSCQRVNIVFDQVRLTFSGDTQNFREVEILGKNSTLLMDSGAPEPLKNNAWRINSEIIDSSGAFTTGDKIKVRLFLNESVTLAKVGSNKIIVANKEFLLTGTNGVTTDTLEFVYIVKINDNISAENFDIDSKEDIVLSDVKDVDGNSINFSAITDSVENCLKTIWCLYLKFSISISRLTTIASVGVCTLPTDNTPR
jgi:hypothetical protein